MNKHLCSIRSLCEGLGKGNEEKIYCVCGKHYKDPIHYTTKEYNALHASEKAKAFL